MIAGGAADGVALVCETMWGEYRRGRDSETWHVDNMRLDAEQIILM